MGISAVIPAAGIGSRLGAGFNKQYIEIADKPMVIHTIESISQHPDIAEVILVVGGDEIEQAQAMVEQFRLHKISRVIAGGKERIYSVINGVKQCMSSADYVLIHDGARPLVTIDIIDRTLASAKKTGAAIAAMPVKDTIKVVDNAAQTIQGTPARQTLWAAQTPQVIRKDWLEQAIEELTEFDQITDDSMLIELTGKPVSIVNGSYENIKVTTPEDVQIAEMILQRRTSYESRDWI